MTATLHAVVLAAGEGRRMGQDKGLLELGGTTAVGRVAAHCAAADLEVLVVRRNGAAALPTGDWSCVVVREPREMIDSLRAGLRALPHDSDGCLVFPVDYAMVAPATVQKIRTALAEGAGAIVLPLSEGRPGHPIGLAASLLSEVLDPQTTSLREVIRRDPARVHAVPVDDPWVRRDLDRPDDLEAARKALEPPETPP